MQHKLFAIILFSSSICFADEYKAIGHIEPFPEEYLYGTVSSINLTGYCSQVSIKEWQEPRQDFPKAISDLDRFCNLAVLKFGFNYEKPFVWNLSFLKQGSCYRCLNDTKYRFIGRKNQNYVDSYTSQTFEYTFLPNIVDGPKFKLYYMHELYHALSMSRGMYGKDNEEKARAFTKKLGLGE